MKLSDLQNKVKKIEVAYQDEILQVTYRVNVVTPGFLSDKPDLYEQLRRVVVSWDILDEDGQQIEPDLILKKLPVQLLDLILQTIVGDMRVGSAQKKE